MWQVQPATLAGRTGMKSTKCHDDAGSDVVSPHSHASIQSPAAEDDSYAATFESESHVASADVNAGDNGTSDNGTIASVCPVKHCDLLGIIVIKTVLIRVKPSQKCWRGSHIYL